MTRLGGVKETRTQAHVLALRNLEAGCTLSGVEKGVQLLARTCDLRRRRTFCASSDH